MGQGTGPVTINGKRPDEIEAEIARTRSELAETLEALEDRLAPRQLLEKGLDMVRDSMDGQSGKIGETLRNNPVPLALIGIGLGWLMLSGGGRSGEGGGYRRRIGSAVGDAAGAVTGRIRGMVGGGGEGSYAHAWTKNEDAARRATADLQGGSSYAAESHRAYAAGAAGGAGGPGIGERARGAVGQVGDQGRQLWESAGDYAGSAGSQLGHARDRFGQLMEEYPLAVGALGFLAGAVVAASLPSTRWEDENLGETRDDLWRQAEEAGREAVGRAQEVASTAAEAASEAAKDAIDKTADAAKEEADRQGLTGGKL
jgi:Protein of unknown function (DUF3618)